MLVSWNNIVPIVAADVLTSVFTALTRLMARHNFSVLVLIANANIPILGDDFFIEGFGKDLHVLA